MDIDAGPILVRLQGQAPAALQPVFGHIAELHEKRLWFELTNVLDQLFKDPNGIKMVLPIYRDLISPIQKRLSPDAFVRFSLLAASQIGNVQEAIQMLLALADELKPTTNTHLYVHARMTAALYQLSTNAVAEAKVAIDECLPLVEAFVGVDPAIRAVFYRVKSEFDKVKANFSAYYRDAFLYLACVNSEDLLFEERVGLAHDLSVAALLGDSVFNFGELLMHPVLTSIEKHAKFGFLVSALNAFNAGDHARFEQEALPAISAHPVLSSRLDFLRQKMCLMALVEGVFAWLKTSRRIPFQAIAERARVPLGEVEFLLMKALSLGLIKGTIDEIEQVMQVEWVQPRVLGREQIIEMRAAIQAWKGRLAGIGESIEGVSAALLPAAI